MQHVPFLLIPITVFKQHRSLVKQRDRAGLLKKKLLLLAVPAGSYLLLLQLKSCQAALLEQHTNHHLHCLSWKYLSLSYIPHQSKFSEYEGSYRLNKILHYIKLIQQITEIRPSSS